MKIKTIPLYCGKCHNQVKYAAVTRVAFNMQGMRNGAPDFQLLIDAVCRECMEKPELSDENINIRTNALKVLNGKVIEDGRQHDGK